MQHRELRIYVSLLLTGMLAVLALRFGVPLPGKAAGLGHYVLTDPGVITARKPAAGNKTQKPDDWPSGRYVLYPLTSVVHNTVLLPGEGFKAHNRRGQALGCKILPGNRGVHALLLEHGRYRDLGTLGGKISYTSALNDAGDI